MYKYMIIDSNFILRRNYSCIVRGTFNNYEQLVESFLLSIHKLVDKVPTENVVLVWDKSPYLKVEAIKQYKKDRKYSNEGDIIEIDKKISEAKTDEEKKKLEHDKLVIERNIIHEGYYMHAKNSIASKLKDTNYHSTILRGYEADDLAYLMAQRIHNDKLGNAVLVSIDNDWCNFVNPSVDYYKLGRGKNPPKWVKYDSSNPLYNRAVELDVSMYESGCCRELYLGGHNNVPAYPHREEVSFQDFCNALVKNIGTIPDQDEYAEYYRVLNTHTYDNSEVHALIDRTLSLYTTEDHATRVKDYFNRMKLNYLFMKYNRLSLDLSSFPFTM